MVVHLMADQVNILSQAIEDQKSKIAVRQLERLLQAAMDRLKAVEETLGASSAGGTTTAVTSVTGMGAIHAAPTTGAVVLTFTGVTSVTAGSSFVTVAPSTGAVVVDVNPSLFGAATGTVNRISKFTAVHTLGDSSVTDDGTTVTVGANAVLGTASSYAHTINGITSVLGPANSDVLSISNYDGGTIQTAASAKTLYVDGSTETSISGGAHSRYGVYSTVSITRASSETAAVTAYGGYFEAFVTGALGGAAKTAYALYTGNGSVYFTGSATLASGASANNNKITNLADGTFNSDAAAFGQIAPAVTTGINAAINGTTGTVPKFTGAHVIGNSSITDDGSIVATSLSTYVGLNTGTTAKIFNVGRDTTLATTAQNGWSVTTYSDGNNYIDSKSYSSGHTYFRMGHGAETGANKTLLDIQNSGAGTTAYFPWTFNSSLTVNGNTVLGDAMTDTVLVNGYMGINSTPDNNVGLKITKPTGATYGIYVASGNLQVQDSVTLGAGSTNTTLVNGYAGFGIVPTSTVQLYVESGRQYGVYARTPAGAPVADNAVTVNATNVNTGKTGTPQVVYGGLVGSFDATAAGRTGYAGYFEATATRSAGANAVTNIGGFFHAANAQNNIALYTYSGDVWLNANSGNTTAFQNFTVNGNTTLGDASADTLTVNCDTSKFGMGGAGGDSAYFRFNTLNFGWNSNANDNGIINAYGYQGGTTQYRDLFIQDGKNTNIVKFTGSTGKATFYYGITNSTTVTLTTAAMPASVNLTTTGTLDWIYLANTTPVQPSSLVNPSGTIRGKSNGPGWVWKTFIWLGEAVRGKANTYASGCTFSSTAADDNIAAALSSANGQYTGSATGSADVNLGFKFAIPTSGTTRTIKMWMQMTSGTATITCKTEDGSSADVTTTVVGAAGVTTHKEVTITVTSVLPTTLTVHVQQTANTQASTSSIGLAAVAIS
jgi:hypothetical protein